MAENSTWSGIDDQTRADLRRAREALAKLIPQERVVGGERFEQRLKALQVILENKENRISYADLQVLADYGQELARLTLDEAREEERDAVLINTYSHQVRFISLNRWMSDVFATFRNMVLSYEAIDQINTFGNNLTEAANAAIKARFPDLSQPQPKEGVVRGVFNAVRNVFSR
jgi:hypothetical protein